MSVTDYHEIVAALRAVPGVANADLQPDDEGGGMGLLRLGLRPGVDEVAVATTVGRLLRERFGLAPTEDPTLSRMTIQTSGSDDVIEQFCGRY